jgi:hypothetical protein
LFIICHNHVPTYLISGRLSIAPEEVVPTVATTDKQTMKP